MGLSPKTLAVAYVTLSIAVSAAAQAPGAPAASALGTMTRPATFGTIAAQPVSPGSSAGGLQAGAGGVQLSRPTTLDLNRDAMNASKAMLEAATAGALSRPTGMGSMGGLSPLGDWRNAASGGNDPLPPPGPVGATPPSGPNDPPPVPTGSGANDPPPP